jgi:1,4-alpha-glucan branching enzyme
MARMTEKGRKTEKVTKASVPAKKGKAKAAEAKGSPAPREPRTAAKAKASRAPSRADKKAPSFTVYEPQATEVFVAGCFNDWNPRATPLERGEAGTWFCTIELEAGQHEYRFVVDGEWRDDPLNVVRCSNEFGTENCVVVVE